MDLWTWIETASLRLRARRLNIGFTYDLLSIRSDRAGIVPDKLDRLIANTT